MDIEITFIPDPGCPWGYSASPSLAALQWRYGPRLQWRLVTIGIEGYSALRLVLEEYQLMNRAKKSFFRCISELGRMPLVLTPCRC